MIKQETFRTKMAEAKDLLGSNMKAQAFDTMYDRLKDYYTNGDFEKAIDAVVENGDKLVYPVLKKALTFYKVRRVESDIKTDKAKEAKEMSHLEQDRGGYDIQSIIKDLQRRLAFEGKFPEIPYIKYNSVIIDFEGNAINCYIDASQPGFEDHLTVVHEEEGGGLMRNVYIDTVGLNIIQRTEREEHG